MTDTGKAQFYWLQINKDTQSSKRTETNSTQVILRRQGNRNCKRRAKNIEIELVLWKHVLYACKNMGHVEIQFVDVKKLKL